MKEADSERILFLPLRWVSVQNQRVGDSDVQTYFANHPLLSHCQDLFDLHCSESLEDTKKGGRSGKHSVSYMASEREYFDLSGPLHLTSVDWDNANNRMTVAASLIQCLYILERDREERREGPNALAPPWWDFFNLKLLRPLVDDVDSSIFGAIYEFKPRSSQSKAILHRRIPVCCLLMYHNRDRLGFL